MNHNWGVEIHLLERKNAVKDGGKKTILPPKAQEGAGLIWGTTISGIVVACGGGPQMEKARLNWQGRCAGSVTLDREHEETVTEAETIVKRNKSRRLVATLLKSEAGTSYSSHKS